MKSAYFVKKNKMEVREVPKAQIEKGTDAVIKIIRACVCGSDLWWFRGISERQPGPVGHEAIGIIEDVGENVKDFQVGDFVIVPFTHGCGHCKICSSGFEANCPNAKDGVNGGYQGEYYRAINADGSLVKIPGKPSDYSESQLASLTTLADVMPTGFHAAKAADVREGDTVVVFGDGAVGLCAIISAKMLGAKRIIAMSRHEDRASLARDFGATDTIVERGEEAIQKIMNLTDGYGSDVSLECVGTKQAIESAFQAVRPGGRVGRVGVPHDVDYNEWIESLFWKNIQLGGGVASVARWDKEILLEAVLRGEINPGRVFTAEFTLNEIQEAYEAMDQRTAIKSLIKF